MKKDTVCQEVLKAIMVDMAKYILELDGVLTDEDLTFIDKETLWRVSKTTSAPRPKP